MKDKSTSSSGSSFISMLTVAFIVLKLVGVITWKWIWVVSPMWIGLVLGLIMLSVIYALKE